MKSFFTKIFSLPVYIHFLVVIAATCLTVYIALKSIDAYTNHNQAVYIPDVRGLQIEEAAPFLENSSLRYEIIDSVFSKEKIPGAIIELMPEANSKVKRNRIVRITINAKTEETAPLPEVVDLSFRQAYAQLKARGFQNVEPKYVAGDYKDLTIGVEYEGNMIDGGTRIPLTAELLLVISDDNIIPLEADSLSGVEKDSTFIIISEDENWF